MRIAMKQPFLCEPLVLVTLKWETLSLHFFLFLRPGQDISHIILSTMVKGKVSGSALRGCIAAVCGAAFLVSNIAFFFCVS